MKEKEKPAGHLAAFALIELLVVIASIAILAAMFFASVIGAKQKTYKAQCGGNSK